MKLTTKQVLILTAIKCGNKDGEACTVYDIMEALPYEVKRDAVLHSVKILTSKGLVQRLGREKRDGHLPYQTFGLTTLGLSFV